MKVHILEHESKHKSVKAVFTTKRIPVLILAKYLASGVPVL